MQPVLSREEMQAFDRAAIDAGVPSIVLMENAGRGAAEAILPLLSDGKRALILCGPGSNGGDGFVVARRLLTLGHTPKVLLIAEQAKGDAAVMQKAWEAAGGKTTRWQEGDPVSPLAAALHEPVVLVDALFGTGLDRPLAGLYLKAVSELNAADAMRVALDLPSGLDANTGRALGDAINAKLTLCFGHYKRGLCTPLGAERAGKVVRIDIGVPGRRPNSGAAMVEASDVAADLMQRGATLHKATAGRVGVLAGSPGKLGAARLVATAALRTGAGLVTFINYAPVIEQLEHGVVEAMTERIERSSPSSTISAWAKGDHTSIVVGPGLGTGEPALTLLEAALDSRRPLVLDADALTLLAAHPDLLAQRGPQCVLTPHTGEAARLLGTTSAGIESDRYGALQSLVDKTSATVLLKGKHTLIGAPSAPIQVVSEGSPVLATGGSGDVLAGVIGALLCHLSPRRAAVVGAFAHGRAGQRWQERTGGDRGMLAGELTGDLPSALAQLSDEV